MITSREFVSYIIVSIDYALMLIIAIALIRLRVFISYTVRDYKASKVFVSDFTVYIPSIPLDPEHYHNDPFLLKAMITKYMESIVI